MAELATKQHDLPLDISRSNSAGVETSLQPISDRRPFSNPSFQKCPAYSQQTPSLPSVQSNVIVLLSPRSAQNSAMWTRVRSRSRIRRSCAAHNPWLGIFGCAPSILLAHVSRPPLQSILCNKHRAYFGFKG